MTEDPVYDRHVQHAPCSNSASREMNDTHALEHIGDVDSNGSMVDDNLKIVFAELDRLDIVTFRYFQAHELSSSVNEFVFEWGSGLQILNPLHPRAPLGSAMAVASDFGSAVAVGVFALCTSEGLPCPTDRKVLLTPS